jgi:hypothetical protein
VPCAPQEINRRPTGDDDHGCAQQRLAEARITEALDGERAGGRARQLEPRFPIERAVEVVGLVLHDARPPVEQGVVQLPVVRLGGTTRFLEPLSP